ncbi:MAG TPA: hypothetical protein VMT16_12820 [Thermoanaerobaculia bacterium]|nr:hypothetical protein [Thermoanaerobaculia bacterium]
MLGAFDPVTGGDQRWQVSMSWRYQQSDRHFRGTHQERERQAEGSEVINDVYLFDLGIRYNLGPKSSISVGIPYLIADRSSPIRDSSRQVVARSVQEVDGIGDITVVGHRLLWDPARQPRGNASFSLGVKAPTGDDGATDGRTRLVDGEYVTTVETVDQSVQAGDGGWGVVVAASGYRLLNGAGTVAAYGSGTYLINPEGTNGVETFRGRDSEAILSIADQYLARLGVQVTPASWRGFGFGLGGRIEGVPVHDLFGSSEGFRRPGYAVSLEPSVSWARGPHTLSLAVPVAVQRNRQRSVPDMQEAGRHGDAAFADWVLLAGYWYRF